MMLITQKGKIKYGIMSILLMFLIPLVSAQKEQSSVLVFSSNGGLGMKINGKTMCTLVPTAANKKWKFSKGTKAGAMGKNSALFSLRASGEIDGEVIFRQKNGGMDLIWSFSAQKNVEFNALAIGFTLSIKNMAGGTWKCDNKEGVFPEKFTSSKIFGKDVSSLIITSPKGETFTLAFPEPIRVGIEDMRKWGAKKYQLRFGKVFGSLSAGETYKIKATVELPGKVKITAGDEVVIRAGKNWVPLAPELDIVSGSALDLSKQGLLKGACGSKGRVIVNSKGHFAFAKDPNTSQRFYGPNLCFSAQYLPKEKVNTLLDRWERMGYNTLRIHHYEFRLTKNIWKTGFDWPKKYLDQLCYLIAECSKRGIWLTTDLFVSRPVSAEQIGISKDRSYIKVREGMNTVDFQYYKALVLVHEPAYQDFIKFTKKFLGHVNPYTGKTLAEEPALAWINLLNEGAPGKRIKNIPQWKTAWNKWLAKRYSGRQALAKAFGDLKDDENTKNGTVNFPKDITNKTMRGRLCQVFMAYTEKKFVKRTRAFLRKKLKCKALLSNHNCPPNYVPDQGARASFDYVDDHYYIDIPIAERGWGLPSTSPNTNPILDGADRSLRSTVIRLWGKPMTISEYNFSGPGTYRAMGPLMTGALASLQGWDVLWRFAYSHKDTYMFKPAPMDYFDLIRDPLSLAADRAAVMLFLRGDLKTAPNRLATVITKAQLQNPPQKSNMGSTAKLAWVTRVGSALYKAPAGAIAVPLTATSSEARAIAKKGGVKISSEKGIIRSETGEIFMDQNKRILCIDTPKTAGGYAEPGQSINASKAGVMVNNITTPTGATVFVTALDNVPIRKSSHLLVTHLTDLQNTNTKFSDPTKSTLLKKGKLPYLVRTGEATVHLSLKNPEKYAVLALSLGGRRIEKIPSKVQNGKLVFKTVVEAPYGARLMYEVTPNSSDIKLEAPPKRPESTGVKAGADILTFNKPFLFTYAGWKDKLVAKESKAVLKAPNSKGGGGYNTNLDFSGLEDLTPVLYASIGNDNKAKSIKVLLKDGKGKKGEFVYSLMGKASNENLRITPKSGARLDRPNIGRSVDLGNIKQVQIFGEWSESPVDLIISALKLEKVKNKGGKSVIKLKSKIDVLTFDTPFLFTYAGWKDKLAAKDSTAVLKAANSKGGGGYNIDLDFSEMTQMQPVLYATVGETNKAKVIKVIFMDGRKKKCSFRYSLSNMTPGTSVRLTPVGNVPLSKPNEGSAIDYSNIKQIQIAGEWSDNPVDLSLSKLTLEKVK